MTSRRAFIGYTGAAAACAARGHGVPVPRLSKPFLDRVEAGRETILNELRPSKAQIDRGLELHYSSFVADTQGNIPVVSGDWTADRLARDLEKLRGSEPVAEARRKRRAFESAFDPQWQQTAQSLYEIAGVRLGSEDVAHPDENTFITALKHIARARFAYDHWSDVLLVRGMDDINRARREKKRCTVFHLAAAGCWTEVENPLEYLDLFFALGIRMSQLTYIQKNRIGCSWLQENDTGLTDVGRQAVRRMNQLGMMVDLAHAGPRTALEAVEVSEQPVLISHTGCKSVYDDASNPDYLSKVLAQAYAHGVAAPARTHSRNADDELIRSVAKKNGVVAIYAIDYVLGRGERARSFATLARHLEHVIKVVGIDHVAIGSDRTFFPSWKPEAMDWTNWPYWTVGLVCRGFSDGEIRKIIGENFLRYASQVLNQKPWGPFI